MTTVKNVKVSYIRAEGYDNLAKWMEDENNVYIGRNGIVFINKERFPKKSSIFANPYKINNDNTREKVLEKYKIYITDKINENPEYKSELLKLQGKNLGCWCHPEKCHGDILVELLNKCINN